MSNSFFNRSCAFVCANAIPLLEDPPSFLTTPHPSFLQSLPKNCVKHWLPINSLFSESIQLFDSLPPSSFTLGTVFTHEVQKLKAPDSLSLK